MNRNTWFLLAILLLSGPTVLPISLEVFFLVELIGFLGIWSICSSYMFAFYSHPYIRRFWVCLTSPEQHLLTYLHVTEIKRCPSLFVHLLPYRSAVAWSVPLFALAQLLTGLRF
ncbi:hypothetical protein [Vibrio hyugaensis]|uniref:hypothetical protein n=1 Tax=Vibrio hyugaensis TaxID=1534743 RepID=UPI0009E62562|nr:hypothetical protein [Vibrio hyugaensis]